MRALCVSRRPRSVQYLQCKHNTVSLLLYKWSEPRLSTLNGVESNLSSHPFPEPGERECCDGVSGASLEVRCEERCRIVQPRAITHHHTQPQPQET